MMYKLIQAKKILDSYIIDNNLIETSRIGDPRYIEAASIAWLRKHDNKTLLDLQLKLQDLRLNTQIFPQPCKDQKVWLPGHHDIPLELKFVAQFMSNPASLKRMRQTIVDPKHLARTGFQMDTDPITEAPDQQSLQSADVYTQLQWASVYFRVEHVVVNPEDMLERDLRSHDTPIKCLLILTREARREKIYAYVTQDGEYISEYGILETTTSDQRATSRIVVYLPPYLASQ